MCPTCNIPLIFKSLNLRCKLFQINSLSRSYSLRPLGISNSLVAPRNTGFCLNPQPDLRCFLLHPLLCFIHRADNPSLILLAFHTTSQLLFVAVVFISLRATHVISNRLSGCSVNCSVILEGRYRYRKTYLCVRVEKSLVLIRLGYSLAVDSFSAGSSLLTNPVHSAL